MKLVRIFRRAEIIGGQRKTVKDFAGVPSARFSKNDRGVAALKRGGT
jgi:hypothetical protein